MFLTGDDTFNNLPIATDVSCPTSMWVNYLTYLGLKVEVLRVGHWSFWFDGWVVGCGSGAVSGCGCGFASCCR